MLSNTGHFLRLHELVELKLHKYLISEKCLCDAQIKHGVFTIVTPITVYLEKVQNSDHQSVGNTL